MTFDERLWINTIVIKSLNYCEGSKRKKKIPHNRRGFEKLKRKDAGMGALFVGCAPINYAAVVPNSECMTNNELLIAK